MAGAPRTSYDASFPGIWVEAMKKPSRAGGKPAKAQRRKALKLKGRNAPRAAPRRSSSRIGQIEVARAPLATSNVCSRPLARAKPADQLIRPFGN